MNYKTLDIRLNALPTMGVKDLQKLWHEVFASDPPRFNRSYFIRQLAYRIQEIAYGTDSRALERRLELHARQNLDAQGNYTRKTPQIDTRPPVGTRLIREHNGETHEVTVLHYGFDYRGKRFQSLSGIAKAITGTHWSGPLFFGLRKQKGI